MSVYVTIDWGPLKDMIRTFPSIANQEANAAYRKVASWFGKEFTANRLRKGIFNPRRKMRMKRAAKGQPSLPAKMRKAGFVARLGGSKTLEGKWLRVYSGSPIIEQREKGGVVRPKKGKYLYIRATSKKMLQRAGMGGGKKGRARKLQWIQKSWGV